MLNLEYEKFFDLYNKAYEKQAEDNLYQMYCAILPNFTSEDYISFAEFKEQNLRRKPQEQAKISDGGKTDDENIAFAQSIMSSELLEKK